MALTQFVNFSIWLAFGFGLGLFSELRGFFRPLFRSRFIADIVMDTITALSSLALAALLSLYIGGVVWYLLLGAALGAFIEKLTLHKPIAKGIETLYTGLTNIVASCSAFIRSIKIRRKKNGSESKG